MIDKDAADLDYALRVRGLSPRQPDEPLMDCINRIVKLELLVATIAEENKRRREAMELFTTQTLPTLEKYEWYSEWRMRLHSPVVDPRAFIGPIVIPAEDKSTNGGQE